jgi:hypothetical protein
VKPANTALQTHLLLGSGSVGHVTAATLTRNRGTAGNDVFMRSAATATSHCNKTTARKCFLCGPSRGYITKTNGTRPIQVIEFNANGIWRQRYELSKQLQGLHTDVLLLSGTGLKPHKRFFISNFHFYRTDRFPGRKGISHNHVDLCYMCDTYT